MKSRTLVGCLSDLFLSVSGFGRFRHLRLKKFEYKTWNILKHYSNNLHLQNWNMRMCIKHWHYLTVSFTESLSQHSDPHFLSDTPALRRGANILIHIHVHVYIIINIYCLYPCKYYVYILFKHAYIHIYILPTTAQQATHSVLHGHLMAPLRKSGVQKPPFWFQQKPVTK